MAVILLAAVWAPAQQGPHFDVISIKLASADEYGPDAVLWSAALDPTHWQIKALTLRSIIMAAYDPPIAADRIEGLPDWASTDRFDINATMPPQTTRSQVAPMMFAMLSDRFKMVAHTATRPMLAATLTVSPHGAKLTRDPGCDHTGDLSLQFFSPESVDKPQSQSQTPPAPPSCGSRTPGAQMGETNYHGVTMARLAFSIRNSANLPVLDQTGLQGAYDFTLNDPSLAAARRMDPDQRAAAADDLLHMREQAYLDQLGLVLTLLHPQKLPVPILVVDHIEHPTPN